MIKDIVVPGVGESVQEAVLAEWFKADGEDVAKDEPLFLIETDKVTLEVVADAAGRLKRLVQEEENVAIGAVVGTLDTAAAAVSDDTAGIVPGQEVEPPAGVAAQAKDPSSEKDTPAEKDAPAVEAAGSVARTPRVQVPDGAADMSEEAPPILSPAVRRLVTEQNLDAMQIPATGPGGRVTKGDVVLHLEAQEVSHRLAETAQVQSDGQAGMASAGNVQADKTGAGGQGTNLSGVKGGEQTPAISADNVRRKPMSPIRKRIAGRLLEAKRNTAMLTTFNDVDMSAVMALRSRYKEAYREKHGVPLGFMSFFIKATVEALKEYPQINAFIEEEDILYHDYYHIGVAIGSSRGLVVPVIRNADRQGFAELEKSIGEFVVKIKENRLQISDLTDGTFTITNGGVFGSLLSTPILNTPQSGILGMHKIEKRAVVVDDEIVIRPMMYLALSYDHRIVDGREAVTFLTRIKAFIENPERMMLEV